jgi:hypothetical protein
VVRKTQHPRRSQDVHRRTILDALKTLGSDPQRFEATGLRAFVLDRANRHGKCQAKVAITALRALVRYLIATGQCQVGLDASIPTIAGWHFSAMPRYISAADVERLIAACDPTTAVGARDRAILLLLSRLACVLAASMPFASMTSIGSRPPSESPANPVGSSSYLCRKKLGTQSYITWQRRVRLQSSITFFSGTQRASVPLQRTAPRFLPLLKAPFIGPVFTLQLMALIY